MKINIFTQEKNLVFTLNAETGKAEVSPDVTMDEVAIEFIRGIETAIMVAASQFESEWTCREVFIRGAKSDNSGDLNIRMGDGPIREGETVEGMKTVEGGIRDGDVNIQNPIRPG